jgi:hypothetical protein
MKTTIVLFVVASALLAEDAPAVLKSETLKPEHREKFLRLQLQEQLTRERAAHALDGDLLPIRLEHNALVKELCMAVGVPEAKIETECRIDLKSGQVSHVQPEPTPAK